MSVLSRRHFVQSLAAATAAAPFARPLSASIVRPFLQAAAEGKTEAVTTLTSGWEFYRDSLAGPWEAWHGDEIATWEKVTVPHCTNHYDACDPDTPYYRGQSWYRTSIPNAVPPNSGRVLLHFEGAGQTTTVWINNQLIGTHIGGYDEFVFDITDALSTPPIKGAIKQPEGTVALTVLCDNSRDLERSPSDLSDFSLYGGLYRKVHLVSVPSQSIEQVHITPSVALNGSATIKIDVKLHSPGVIEKVSGEWVVKDPAGKVIAHGTDFSQAIRMDSAKLWSPLSPRLYTASVTLDSDSTTTHTERFGLKHTEWIDHGPFKLNGERLFLQGTQRHMDHANYAAAMPEDLIRKEFELMKAMGVNFVRLAHYQQTRFVLDLCDELGILVWEESTWCREGIGDAQWQAQTKQAFTNLIQQHYNHPCILIWGLGNEDDWPNEYPSLDKTAIRTFMQQMHDLAHSLDPMRVTGFRRCDFAADIPDVYSPSIWAGWYSGVYSEYQKSLETWRPKVKHLLHIEWGADSHARRHAEDPYANLPAIATGHGTAETGLAYRNTGGPARVSRDGDWSESYACDLFDWSLKTQQKPELQAWFAGSAQWIFKDFTTPLRVENPVPRINQKGLLERDMTPKEGYYVFQSYWSDVPMVRLYGHTWPVRWGKPDEQRLVKVYSNCPQAELFLNGVSVGTKHRDSQDFPCAGLRWMVNFQPGKNHLRVVATPAHGKPLSDEIDFVYQNAPWSKPEKFILRETSRTTSTVTLLATLVDAQGLLCLDAKNTVRFSLAGSGALIDNQGTSTASRVVQLYNGRAEISVRITHGSAELGVQADGLPDALCAIQAS